MTKTELIKNVASRLGKPERAVGEIADCLIEVVSESLSRGEPVQLIGFGTFERKERAARTGVNPATKETIEIPATHVPSFKAGKALKDRVANKKEGDREE